MALAYGEDFVGTREDKVDGWEFLGSLITSSSSPNHPPLNKEAGRIMLRSEISRLGGLAKHKKYNQYGQDNPNYKNGLRVSNRRVHDDIYRKVRTALESKIITKGTCECGSTDVLAHHEDYLKAFEVKWVCRFHHAQIHK